MSFEVRFVLIVLAAFAWSSLVTAAVVPWLFRRIRARATPVDANAILRLRLLPAGVGLGASTLAAMSFLLFEPRVLDESYGLVLRVLAGLTVVLLLASLARGVVIWWRTRAALRAAFAGAARHNLAGASLPTYIVDTEFPIVAVTGLLRSRLLVARSVVDACQDGELRAVLAHEQAHAERRDNLKRLAVVLAPDVLAGTRWADAMHRAWREAAEFAADDAAEALGPGGRPALAAALLRVARLAPRHLTLPVPASALYRGENLGVRVARLLAPAVPISTDRRWSGAAGWTLAVCLVMLEGLHELFETAVAILP